MDKRELEDLANKNGLTVNQLNQLLFSSKINVNSDSYEKQLEDVFEKLFLSLNNKHKNRSNLKSFEIKGLFNKDNNYKFDFVDDVNIFVSENGIGKTTILKLLISVLESDYETLNEINFEKIILRIGDSKYVIDKNKICSQLKEDYVQFIEMLKPVLNPDYYMELINNFNNSNKINISHFEYELRKLGRNRSESYYLFRRGYRKLEELKEKEADILKIQLGNIKTELNCDVIFYPTYRKIEAPKNKIFFSSNDDFEISNKYISFGMNDVEQQINILLSQLRSSTSRAYAEINTKIINDLASEELEKLISSSQVIDSHKFDVVINRIGKDNITCYEKLKSFVEGKITNLPNGDFLKYYINKLISIYDIQKPLNDKLVKFTEICNKYLVNKKFVYNESTLQLDIVSHDNEERIIDINDLSSGEKQVVSIFSKVYLELSTPSIFIIDEPEISLSIEWQKQFLIDIYESRKVNLLIATTHSPFIFKNEFREYTKDMDIFRK